MDQNEKPKTITLEFLFNEEKGEMMRMDIVKRDKFYGTFTRFRKSDRGYLGGFHRIFETVEEITEAYGNYFTNVNLNDYLK